MVRAYHLILTCYGFWLPNDPRGSWSGFVRSFELYCVGGQATKVHTKQSVASHGHNHHARLRAKQALQRPPVIFTGRQARAVTRGFGDYAQSNGRRVYACSVMPDHAHLVIERDDKPIETVATQLKARATYFLNQEDLHPFAGKMRSGGRAPTPWARKCWSVFLRTNRQIQHTIKYVEQNPIRAGQKPQRYRWITDFNA